MNDKILFAGPWVKYPGYLPLRVVLHAYIGLDDKLVEYVVHYQTYQQDFSGKMSYDTGHYFPVHAFGDEALPKAMERFWEKCQRKYNSGTPDHLIDDPLVAEDEFLAILATGSEG